MRTWRKNTEGRVKIEDPNRKWWSKLAGGSDRIGEPKGLLDYK